MKATSSFSASLRFFSFLTILTLLLVVTLTTSCGSSPSAPPPPRFSGNTSVTVLLSSTANDELQRFAIGMKEITLTSQSGKAVTLYAAAQDTESWAEFIHVNGNIDPFVTVSVPQGIYTAATVKVGESYFTCVGLTPSGGLLTATFAYGSIPGNAPATNVTVNLASPITITGESLGLVLDLQAAQSAIYPSCYTEGIASYSITPTFNLATISLAPAPSNVRQGKVTQLNGEVTATSSLGNGFTVALPNSQRTLSIGTSSSTAYQGISGFSGLSAGTFVDLDGAVRADGSILATRVAVMDPSAVDVQVGPTMIVGGDPLNGELSGWFFNRASQGQDMLSLNWPYNIRSAVFQVSGQMGNLSTLPFVASFNGSNLVAGQNVYVSTTMFDSPSDPYTPASTLTLMPQTINGTIVDTQRVGNFTQYTVALASYDLFPSLAVQQGQTTLLSNPDVIEVYADNATQKLNTQALAPGNVLRFYGLVFNDNGTLRMDCAQMNDGVTATAQSKTGLQAQRFAQMNRRIKNGVLEQTITTTR